MAEIENDGLVEVVKISCPYCRCEISSDGKEKHAESKQFRELQDRSLALKNLEDEKTELLARIAKLESPAIPVSRAESELPVASHGSKISVGWPLA